MATGTQACDVVLPGYTLVDRIGAGGYAEVWRAEAPGGLQKAVKIVYGYYDDEFASQELKALERIKGVRHPFLLSLERFEVVNGRLAILTELADMSLDQRLRQCRAEGLPGIPREELLRYMADAAEALDFLSQRHSLLHLDIKPENLLILGDHIKVADFGLVKELATRTQNSLVSGMTPTYASPEMFDDAPSAQSDQYSLAIVYQEMLSSKLPFPGRTAAQLAKQHMQAEPQLMSLPVDDRPVVGRALAKQPADRFASCREFVEELMHRREVARAAPAETPRPAAPAPSVPDPSDTKTPSFCATIRVGPGHEIESLGSMVTHPVSRGASAADDRPVEAAAAPEPFVPEESVDVAVPELDPQLRREQATLYVAIGGVGIQVLCRLRASMASRGWSDAIPETVSAIALDTDRDELRGACSRSWKLPLASEDTLHMPLRLPGSYDNAREFLGWVSRRWLYNIPRSLETRGYRPLGRVALVDNSRRLFALIDNRIEKLSSTTGANDGNGEPRDETIRVVLLLGTGGGTGAGMAIDVANAVRSRAAAKNVRVDVQAMLVCPSLASSNSTVLAAANTYSLLTELAHATARGNVGSTQNAGANQPFESREAPFDSVYLLPTHARNNANSTDSLDVIAKYLALEMRADFRSAFRSCRAAGTQRKQANDRSLALRKFGYAAVADQMHAFINELAVELGAAIKRHWFTEDRTADWARLVSEERQAASVLRLEPAVEGTPSSEKVFVPVNDATPLALRGRLEDYLSLEFASEVLRQVQRRLEARDERGRPIILARDAKQIVDAARDDGRSIAAAAMRDSDRGARFTESPVLSKLITAGSERVLRRAIEQFDPRQPDRFFLSDLIDSFMAGECESLLKESLTAPEVSAALTALFDFDRAMTQALELATTDFLQCGCERRTMLFAPKEEAQGAAAEKLRAARPLAAVVASDVDDFIVVSEEAGISPRSLALGLERVYPGISSAGRRLLTRSDIEWAKLG